jgi:hypothetical protein
MVGAGAGGAPSGCEGLVVPPSASHDEPPLEDEDDEAGRPGLFG